MKVIDESLRVYDADFTVESSSGEQFQVYCEFQADLVDVCATSLSISLVDEDGFDRSVDDKTLADILEAIRPILDNHIYCDLYTYKEDYEQHLADRWLDNEKSQF